VLGHLASLRFVHSLGLFRHAAAHAAHASPDSGGGSEQAEEVTALCQLAASLLKAARHLPSLRLPPVEAGSALPSFGSTAGWGAGRLAFLGIRNLLNLAYGVFCAFQGYVPAQQQSRLG